MTAVARGVWGSRVSQVTRQGPVPTLGKYLGKYVWIGSLCITIYPSIIHVKQTGRRLAGTTTTSLYIANRKSRGQD